VSRIARNLQNIPSFHDLSDAHERRRRIDAHHKTGRVRALGRGPKSSPAGGGDRGQTTSEALLAFRRLAGRGDERAGRCPTATSAALRSARGLATDHA